LYKITESCSGLALSIAASSQNPGAMVMLSPWVGGYQQKFRIEATPTGSVLITARHSGLVLDSIVTAGTKSAQVLQQVARDNDSQRWSVEDAGTGLVYLGNKTVGKVTAVKGSTDLAPLQLQASNGSCGQKWKLELVLPYQATATVANSLKVMLYDGAGAHEDLPKGVPSSYSWSTGARISPDPSWPADFYAMTAWGQLYEGASNKASNTRVAIKEAAAWILDKNGKWYEAQAQGAVAGAAYVTDFVNDASKPADARIEPDGAISVRADENFNYHFWPASGRAVVEPSNVKGICSSFKARLVIDDHSKPDDRARASYVADSGADTWRSLDAPWKSDWSNNYDMGLGRMKRVTSEWQSFNMCNVSPDKLRLNSPSIR
jgi:hypothetical protein